MDNTKYGKHIVTTLQPPEPVAARLPEYSKWATRILWMDKNLVPGAFQMNTSWYRHPSPEDSPERFSHRHDTDEIIGFFSPNWEKPYDLGAEIEFWLEDEKHIITSSAMIFVPAGMNHCPLILRKVDAPIFHFSVVTKGTYEMTMNEWQPGQK
jgi:hypothetical protein